MPGRARHLAARAQRRAARPTGAVESQISAARADRRLQPLSGEGAARLRHLRVRDARRRERLAPARARARCDFTARALQVQPDPVQPVPELRIPPLRPGAYSRVCRNSGARRGHRHHAQDARRRHRRCLRPARGRRGRPHPAQRPHRAEGSPGVMRVVRLAAIALIAGCAAQTTEGPTVETGQVVGESGDPRNRARLHTELASLYYSRGSMNVALDELRIAVSADPSYATAYGLFGLVYMELKENTLAEQNFERALRLAPNEPDLNHNYGLYLCQTSREKDSIKYFLQAIRNPLYRTAWRSYAAAGTCSLRVKNIPDADEFFQRALKMEPDEPASLLQLGQIRYQQGRMDDARTLVLRHNKVATPSAESLWLALRIERKTGQRAAEQSYGTQLRRRFPASDEFRKLQRGEFE